MRNAASKQKPAAVGRTARPKAPAKPKTRAKPKPTTFSATKAKDEFPAICRAAAIHKVYVQDRAGRLALAVDPKEPKNRPATDVSAQEFKANFSQFAAAAKLGMIFRVSVRGVAPVYVRRHSRYRDALTPLALDWIESLENAAAEKAEAEAVRDVFAKIKSLEAVEAVEIIERLDRIVRGVERIGLGHMPYRQAQLPPDEDEPPSG